MNRIWANRLEAGSQTWSNVPASRKTAVKATLLADIETGVITQEQYLAIVTQD